MADNVALADEIAEIAGRINVATHRLLTCVRRFDEAEGWFAQGAQSCAHWLTWRIGMDPGTAREKVRVARALGALPAIDEAFAAGGGSYPPGGGVDPGAAPGHQAPARRGGPGARGA